MAGHYQDVKDKLQQGYYLPANAYFPFVIFFLIIYSFPSLYAIRNPLEFNKSGWIHSFGMEYLYVVISLQLAGLLLSILMKGRFIDKRLNGWVILLLMGLSCSSLLSFAILSFPYQVPFILINGTSLGSFGCLIFSPTNK